MSQLKKIAICLTILANQTLLCTAASAASAADEHLRVGNKKAGWMRVPKARITDQVILGYIAAYPRKPLVLDSYVTHHEAVATVCKIISYGSVFRDPFLKKTNNTISISVGVSYGREFIRRLRDKSWSPADFKLLKFVAASCNEAGERIEDCKYVALGAAKKRSRLIAGALEMPGDIGDIPLEACTLKEVTDVSNLLAVGPCEKGTKEFSDLEILVVLDYLNTHIPFTELVTAANWYDIGDDRDYREMITGDRELMSLTSECECILHIDDTGRCSLLWSLVPEADSAKRACVLANSQCWCLVHTDKLLMIEPDTNIFASLDLTMEYSRADSGEFLIFLKPKK